MSQKAVERALGKLVTDEGFRDEFFRDPAGTCHRAGLDLTAAEIGALARVPVPALAALAAVIDGRICRLYVPCRASSMRAVAP